MILATLIKIILIIAIAPVVGGLIAGADRIITARMQSRQGPPLLQPFYDVMKLFQKQSKDVTPLTKYFVAFSLFFNIFTAVLFFTGSNFLLVIFSFTIACVFFILAGYSSYSPYSYVGAERELLQVMSYEPMILLVVFGFYEVHESFRVAEIMKASSPLIFQLPLIFLGLLYILTIKLRKSPFDLSMSHHGHQEIVKGITTEITGKSLALAEISHWYEIVFAMGLVYMFFVYASPFSHLLAVGACVVVYFIEILIDNTFTRARWQLVLKFSWVVTLVLGGTNLLLVNLFK